MSWLVAIVEMHAKFELYLDSPTHAKHRGIPARDAICDSCCRLLLTNGTNFPFPVRRKNIRLRDMTSGRIYVV